jgi:predicted AAA+ superfamily ATPase
MVCYNLGDRRSRSLSEILVSTYIPRLADPELADIVTSHPAVLLVGPRACGKTTTARRLCRSAIQLDVRAQADVVRADPDAALRGLAEPILIDEWQLVPDVLGAVKRAVDIDPRPGRFVLTGSSQADLTASGWPATGRVIRLAMYPLVGRERHGDVTEPSLVDRLLDHGNNLLAGASTDWTVHEYVDESLSSGWPDALRAGTERARDRWQSGYVDQLVSRDAPALGLTRDPARLRRYLQALAANTAGTPTHKLIYDAAGLGRETAVHYDDLLELVMITQRVPAWADNRMDRAARLPKRQLIDPGLLRPLLRIDHRRVMRDGDLLGRLLDTLVTAQFRAECTISTIGADLFHWRDKNNRREIDLIIETHSGELVAIEIKASASATASDARHLEWFREHVGPRLIAALVVHTGPRTFRLSDHVHAVPIASLWA